MCVFAENDSKMAGNQGGVDIGYVAAQLSEGRNKGISQARSLLRLQT